MDEHTSGWAERRVSARWDRCAENFVVKLGFGLAAGAVGALLLFKGRPMRLATVGFGAGCGVGSSWTACRLRFAEEQKQLLGGNKAEQTSGGGEAPAAASSTAAPTSTQLPAAPKNIELANPEEERLRTHRKTATPEPVTPDPYGDKQIARDVRKK